ncbi:MAG: ATP-binding cassette domain-containing protein, partial [Candidatus Omnitrophica bacterium]|nr:ATP-binding cassette domain-containing protein [Candidatus Omnitrophota bacterium]
MVKLDIDKLQIRFDKIIALKEVTLQVMANEILSIIGPANSGKTTFLRMLNRLNQLESNFHMSGSVKLDAEDINLMNIELLRKRIGMVFALPLPLPLSIFDNVAYGVRMHGTRDKKTVARRVEQALKKAVIWDEVKDRLRESAFKLSGGQQQRLCIARTLAVEPEVI